MPDKAVHTHTHTAHILVGGQYLAGWPPRKTIRSSESTRKASKYGASTNIYDMWLHGWTWNLVWSTTAFIGRCMALLPHNTSTMDLQCSFRKSLISSLSNINWRSKSVRTETGADGPMGWRAQFSSVVTRRMADATRDIAILREVELRGCQVECDARLSPCTRLGRKPMTSTQQQQQQRQHAWHNRTCIPQVH